MLTYTMTDEPAMASLDSPALNELRAHLQRLHVDAGAPSTREIRRRLGGSPSHATVNNVLRCEKVPNWAFLEPIVRVLGGDVDLFRRLWTTSRQATPAGTTRSDDQIELLQCEPADLGHNCVLPHALDDQWVPRSLLRVMAAEGRSLDDLGDLRRDLLHQEYVRSLVTTRRIVINRSYLLRNPVLSSAYTADAASRAAFTDLLRTRAIVPFLYTERSPLQSDFAKDPDAQATGAVWNEILHSVTVMCVRLSWDDDANRQSTKKLEDTFALGIRQAAGLNFRRLLADAGAGEEDAGAFGERLRLLPRLGTPTAELPLTRAVLYERHIIKQPGRISDGKYDFTKPYMIALKWLFDLVYNSNLASALGVALTTPVDSAHRSVVHSPNFFQPDGSSDGFDTRRVRTAIMETIQDALFARDFATGAVSVFEGLTLADVVAIRSSETWRRYMLAVDALLNEPWLLSHPERGLPYVYGRYGDLIEYIGGTAGRRGGSWAT